MSRSILIKVVFNNGKSRQRGIYNPTNAEYIKSKLSYTDMLICLDKIQTETSKFKIKKVEVSHNISTGNSRECWEKCTQHYNDPYEIEACKLVDVNNALYKSHLTN